MARRESRTTPRRIKAIERQAQALRLRAAGHTYAKIARVLGFASRQAAHKSVMGAMIRKAIAPETLLEATLDIIRVDELFAPAYLSALAGDLVAINLCLAIIERRAQLVGLDPSRNHIKHSR